MFFILESGARVEYFDHHDPSELIDHPNIVYHIDTDPHMTTGRIVDIHVNGKTIFGQLQQLLEIIILI